MKDFAKKLRAHLESKLYTQRDNTLWKAYEFGYGNTESRFYISYELDFDALEKEIDAWAKETFYQGES